MKHHYKIYKHIKLKISLIIIQKMIKKWNLFPYLEMCKYLSSKNSKMGSLIPQKKKEIRISREENQSEYKVSKQNLTCKRWNASSISSTVSPLFSRKDRLCPSEEVTTFGCFRKLTALWTRSSLISSVDPRSAFPFLISCSLVSCKIVTWLPSELPCPVCNLTTSLTACCNHHEIGITI